MKNSRPLHHPFPDRNCSVRKLPQSGGYAYHEANGHPESDAHSQVSGWLEHLPVIKTSSGFDKKMAALFALEIERELQVKNRSLLQKKKGIRLPDLISDLRAEFQ